MKKTVENRYPNSAALFKFCKEALEIRYDGNVKVIDQDVGAILGYDPADCSHWKKGKKNIRALNTLKSIADHLNIDQRLLIDIASGRVSLEEAVFEYKGYGEFFLHGARLENLKKDFFKNPGKWQKGQSNTSFEDLFKIDRQKILEVVDTVLENGQFLESPIYLPEVYQLFPSITLEQNDQIEEAVKVHKEQTESAISTRVFYRGSEMKPFMRFVIAKELFKHLVSSQHEIVEAFHFTPDEIVDIQANIFAELLLVPSKFLKKEVNNIDNSLDIVVQLAEKFWVSYSLMNQRIRDFSIE